MSPKGLLRKQHQSLLFLGWQVQPKSTKEATTKKVVALSPSGSLFAEAMNAPLDPAGSSYSYTVISQVELVSEIRAKGGIDTTTFASHAPT
ncbi:hypothetical protein FF1_029799 [Malus domestica]